MFWKKKIKLSGEVLDDAGLLSLFPESVRKKFTMPDTGYAVVNYAFVREVCKRYWNKMAKHNTLSWAPHHDCNKKALAWKNEADLLFAEIQGRNLGFGRIKACSPAAGFVFYTKDIGDPHAINFVVTDGRLMFVEPKTGEEQLVTGKERKSIQFAYV